MNFAKLFYLASDPGSLAWRLLHRIEVVADRGRVRAASRLNVTCGQLSEALEECVPGFQESILQEAALMDVEEEISRRFSNLLKGTAFSLAHNGDCTLGRMCYAACRAMQPENVVETGVAYGITTAYILAALEANGHGTLGSVDLPPLASNASGYVGMAVPERLRSRWRLYAGPTRLKLPIALREAGQVNIFIHDSLHTYRTMNWEFKTALTRLSRPGLIISDDVEGNSAFEDMMRIQAPFKSHILLESNKKAQCGIALFKSLNTP